MKRRTLTNLIIGILAVLAAALFGLGQWSLLWPGCLAVAAVVSLRYTDMRQRFALGPAAVNALIFLTALLTVWRYFKADGTTDAEIVAQAVACLLGVLLFERKTPRTYWDLFSLSLVLTLLSTALVQGPLFGILLIVYCFVAFSTLALLYLDSEQRLRAGREQSVPRARKRPVRTTWAALLRLVGIAVSTLLVGPLALFLRFHSPVASEPAPAPRPANPLPARRWPWAGQVPATAAGSGQDARIAAEFWWRMVPITLGSVAVAIVAFCVTPSFGRMDFELPALRDVAWRDVRPTRQRMVGYDELVRLGEMGTATESEEMVLEIRLNDFAGGQPFTAAGGLYVRGSVLTEYREGHWLFQEFGSNAQPTFIDSDTPVSPGALVRQTIAVEPSDRSDLFCLWPFAFAGEGQPVRFDVRTERLRRPRNLVNRSFSFELATTAFVGNSQADLTPNERPLDQTVLLQWPESALPGLAALARQWAADAGSPATDPVGVARSLEQRFHQSRRFRYRLAEEPRAMGVDPVEDFVTNDSAGHCEYFASALALMLRSQGIPARLVLGYRTEDYSPMQETYRVRQSHAHAWVEAYIAPELLPASLAPAGPFRDWSQGAWLRLDPTPASSDADRDWFLTRQWQALRDWGHAFWRDHVQGMDGARRRAAMYREVAAQVREMTERLAQTGEWSDAGDRRWWDLDESVVARGWMAGLGLVLCVVLMRSRSRARKPAPDAAARAPRVAARRNGRPVVDFYRRFEALLARHGQTRAASQTAREFAVAAGARISAQADEPEVAELAVELADAYYLVRFGDTPLDAPRTSSVEHALQQIKRAATRRPNGRRT